MNERNGSSRKTTESKPTAFRKLTVRQQRVLAELLRGVTITKAAESVGVRRETVHGWMQQPLFRAEYGDGCERLKIELEDRLVTLATKAADVACEALESGDTKVAMEILRMVNRDKSQIDMTVEHEHTDAELDAMVGSIIADLRSNPKQNGSNDDCRMSTVQPSM